MRSRLEERLLWQMKVTGLPDWVEEYRFDAVRRWRFDFAWPARMLAVEVEGGTWTGGRHTRPQGFAGDCEKYNAAAFQGWTVLRFTGQQVKSGQAINTLELYLNGQAGRPEEGSGDPPTRSPAKANGADAVNEPAPGDSSID